MRPYFQNTLLQTVSFQGIGLHTGCEAKLKIHPAEADFGIQCIRKDVSLQPFQLSFKNILRSELCTKVGLTKAHSVSTVEHLMSALSALTLDNVLIEIEGPEVPILDGASQKFYQTLKQAGIKTLKPRRYVTCLDPIKVEKNGSFISFTSSNESLIVDCEIEFSHSLIGKQTLSFDLYKDDYENYLSKAKTFGFLKDEENLKKKGLALGANKENVIIFGENNIENSEISYYKDVCVRHKVLDIIGDLFLFAQPLLGRVQTFKPSHYLVGELLRNLSVSELKNIDT